MADLTTLRRTDATCLTVGPRSHVVVEQEVLVRLRAEGVHQLVHARHGHRDDVHHLGLATLEQAGAVRRREHGDLAAQRTQVARTATVDACTLVDDALAHCLLGEAADSFLDLAFAAGERSAVTSELGDGIGGDGVGGGVAFGLAGDRGSERERGGGHRRHRVHDVLAVVELRRVGHRDDRALGGDHRSEELALQPDRLLDVLLAGFEAASEGCFVDLRSAVGVVVEALRGTAGLDHHDRDVTVVELTTGHDELERARLALFVGRVRDPLAGLAVRDSHRTDGTVERDARDHQRSRGGVDAQHVVRVRHVGAEDREHDLGLVAEALGECRTQRAVGEAAGEDRILGGTALTTEERARDLAGGVRTLFDVDGEREEVGARTDVLGSVRGGEHGGAAQACHDGPLALRARACRSRTTGSCRCPQRDPTLEWHLPCRAPFGRASCVPRLDGWSGGRFPVGTVGAATG